jgi:hypothetical protein
MYISVAISCFAKKLLCYFYSRLNFSISFTIPGAYGTMLEFPRFGKSGECFTGKLCAIVAYYCFWTAVSGEMVFKLGDHSRGGCG